MVDDAQAEWLDTEERQAWLALVAVSTRLTTVMDTQMQRDADMTMFEYLTLAVLSEQATRTLPMSTIAAFTTSTLPRLSHVVKRLEQRGWIRRAVSPDDRRITLASLTDAGWDAVVAAAPRHVGHVRETVFDRLTRAQVRQLAAIGGRLLPALWPEGVPPVELPGTPEGCTGQR